MRHSNCLNTCDYKKVKGYESKLCYLHCNTARVRLRCHIQKQKACQDIHLATLLKWVKSSLVSKKISIFMRQSYRKLQYIICTRRRRKRFTMSDERLWKKEILQKHLNMHNLRFQHMKYFK